MIQLRARKVLLQSIPIASFEGTSQGDLSGRNNFESYYS